ncbi:hypothetical protein LBMAG42_18670 [Deltaproteobacteria bacterium]|nr:hypothetical protein LBMAG42_18670 [Deltaproteobacteria bacterium]
MVGAGEEEGHGEWGELSVVGEARCVPTHAWPSYQAAAARSSRPAGTGSGAYMPGNTPTSPAD